MRYLLDTNICVYLIKRRPPQLLQRFRECGVGDIGLSSVTLAELNYGIAKSQFPARNRQALDAFLLPLEILSFDARAASVYGGVRAKLELSGKPIGAMDLMIGSHALSLDVTLVTNKTREFKRVKGLRLENWV